MSLLSPRIGIVTALPKEFAAMKVMLESPQDCPQEGDPNAYVLGTISGKHGTHTIVATLLPHMGNNSAAVICAYLLRSFPTVEDVLMVGIAAGIPHPNDVDKHVRLGDIVVSDKTGIVQYDNLKVSADRIEVRDTSSPPSARLITYVRVLEAERLEGSYPWEQYITSAVTVANSTRPSDDTDRLFAADNPTRELEHPRDPYRIARPGMPKIHYGKIGSANILMKDPVQRDIVAREHGVRAIEMEASGIADATWTSGRQYLVIRGISDYGDASKNDVWQSYAAIAAAAYARALIQRTPALPGPAKPASSLNNLDVQFSSFIERPAESGQLCQLVKNSRLITLTGPPGAGKTRLCLQVAVYVLDTFRDGAWQVDLEPISDAEQLSGSIASVLSLKEVKGENTLQTLTRYLKDKHLLLVLDNCEHLVTECSRIVKALLYKCPKVKVIATSTQPLGLAGERCWMVLPLDAPRAKESKRADSIGKFDAVRLFVDRAREVSSKFELTDENAPWAGKISRQLDGLPLALELAAAWADVLSLREISTRLGDCLSVLVRRRQRTEKHDALRATIDWSYDLLPEQERELFCSLGLFRGPFTSAAVNQICLGENVGSNRRIPLLLNLVKKSFVEAMPSRNQTRYRLLHTMRVYAAEHLASSQNEPLCRERFVHYFMSLSAGGESALERGFNVNSWMTQLTAEQGNIRSAMELLIRDGSDKAVTLAACLGRFWWTSGQWSYGLDLIRRILKKAPRRHPSLPKMLMWAANLALRRGNMPLARDFCLRGLAQARQLRDPLSIAQARNTLASIAWARGEYQSSFRIQRECLRTMEKLGDSTAIATLLHNMGVSQLDNGHYKIARRYFSRALRLCHKHGDPPREARNLCDLAVIEADAGSVRLALKLYAKALALAEAAKDQQLIVCIVRNMGHALAEIGDGGGAERLYDRGMKLALEVGDERDLCTIFLFKSESAMSRRNLESARSFLKKSIVLAGDLKDYHSLPGILERFAELALMSNDALRSARLIGAADRLRKRTGLRVAPNARAKFRGVLLTTKRRLTPATFRRMYAAGQAMSIGRAVAYAVNGGEIGR